MAEATESDKKTAGAAGAGKAKAAAKPAAAKRATTRKATAARKTAAKAEGASAEAEAAGKPAAKPAEKKAPARTTKAAAKTAAATKTAAAKAAKPAAKTADAKAAKAMEPAADGSKPAEKKAAARTAKAAAEKAAKPAAKETEKAAAPVVEAEAKPAASAAPAKKATARKATAKKTAAPAEAAKAEAEAPAAEEPKPAAKKPAAKRLATRKSAAKKAAPAEAAAAAAPEATSASESKAEPDAEAAAAAPEAAPKPQPKAEPDAIAKPAPEDAPAEKPEAAPQPKAEEKPAEAAPKPEPAPEAQPEKAVESGEPAAEAAGDPVAEAAAKTTAAAVAETAAAAEEPASEFAGIPGVLIAAAEAAPLVKVGGLADVVGALPKYLKKLGVDARIIMPFHRAIKDVYRDRVEHMADFQASLGWRSQYVGLEKLELDGTTYYFIDNEFYFGGPIYCGGEFEGEQYAFFTRAVMDSIPLLDFDVRILHCNDWHTAMMPLLVKTQYQGGMQAGLKTVLTIHNLHFQGQFSHEFDRDLLRVDDSLATPQFIEHYGCDNMLKAGIVFADKVNTVSPTYAGEICDPYLGESLDGVLRSRGGDLWGILNGIDVDVWDPVTDPALAANFTASDLSGKAEVKNALLDELGLWRAPEGEEVPLIAMVGRLTPQKGIDLLRPVLDDLMRENVRVVVLGAGDKEYEDFLRDAENRYKGRLCAYIGYAGELSHRIYAGADLFLMPSLFEPCGISQMIAMRYGTLPIVRETGGLRDTVAPYNEYTGEGTGFSFANYNAHEMLDVIRYALATWWNKPARDQLVQNAMAADFSFDRCARTYAELYRSLNA